MELTSEPASGSDTQNAARATFSGVPKHCGSHSPTCSGVPLAKMPATPSVVPKMASPIPASPHAISSITIGVEMPVGSANMLATKSSEYRPILAASWMIGQGVSSRSSHSWAAGRTTFSAKSWTHFWSWIWSSLRAMEKSGIGGTLLVSPKGRGWLPDGNIPDFRLELSRDLIGPVPERPEKGEQGHGGQRRPRHVRRTRRGGPQEGSPYRRAGDAGERGDRLLRPEGPAPP